MNIWLDLFESGDFFKYLTRFIWIRWIVWIFDQVYCKPGGPPASSSGHLKPDSCRRRFTFCNLLWRKKDLPFIFYKSDYKKWSKCRFCVTTSYIFHFWYILVSLRHFRPFQWIPILLWSCDIQGYTSVVRTSRDPPQNIFCWTWQW